MAAIFKAYLDDSGDGDSPGESHLTIAGYLSDYGSWDGFELEWNRALGDAKVPYLHMREFGDPKSPIYGHLKQTPRESQFLKGLIHAIHDIRALSVATTVPMADLRAFNAKHQLDLDPYALCIYGCIIQMRRVFFTDEIDIVLDKFDKSQSRAAMAWGYARSDRLEDLKADLLTPIPLQKDESWKDISPLQAADFLAWEVRKFRYERTGWKFAPEIKDDRELLLLSYREWDIKNKPRERNSFQALRETPIYRPHHFMLDQHRLEDMLVRHPNGWGE